MQKDFSRLIKITVPVTTGGVVTHCKARSPYVFPGDIIFSIQSSSPEVSGYFVIVPDHQGANKFAAEVGWSRHARFPELPRRPFGQASLDRAEFARDEFTCRLSTLWGEEDYWWESKCSDSSRLKEEFAALVEDVGRKFVEHGIPYLDAFFSSRGLRRVEPSSP